MLCEQYYTVAPDLEVEEFNGNYEINLTDIRKCISGICDS